MSRRQGRLYSPEDWDFARAACSQVQPGPLPSAEGFGSHDFVVERVLDRRVRDGVREILVKWSGFSEKEWIPETNVVPGHLPSLLRAWKLAKALADGKGPALSRLRRLARE